MSDTQLPEQFYVEIGSVNLSFVHGVIGDKKHSASRRLTLSGQCFQLAKYAESADELFGSRIEILEADRSAPSVFRVVSYQFENEPKLEALIELGSVEFEKLVDLPLSIANIRLSITIEYSDDHSLISLSKTEPFFIPILGFSINGGPV